MHQMLSTEWLTVAEEAEGELFKFTVNEKGAKKVKNKKQNSS